MALGFLFHTATQSEIFALCDGIIRLSPSHHLSYIGIITIGIITKWVQAFVRVLYG